MSSYDSDEPTEEENQETDSFDEMVILISDFKESLKQIIASGNYEGDINILESILADTNLEEEPYIVYLSTRPGNEPFNLLKSALEQYNNNNTISETTITELDNLFAEASGAVEEAIEAAAEYGGSRKRNIYKYKYKNHKRKTIKKHKTKKTNKKRKTSKKNQKRKTLRHSKRKTSKKSKK